jgi:hypothetical protein
MISRPYKPKKKIAKEGRPLLSCVKGLRSPTLAHMKQIKDYTYYLKWMSAVFANLDEHMNEMMKRKYWNEEDLALIRKSDTMILLFREHVREEMKQLEEKKRMKKEKKK